MGEEKRIVKTIKQRRNKKFYLAGNVGAWEATGRLQNREKSQRGRLHRRQLSGRQDEREGRFLQSAETFNPLLQVVVKFQDDTWLEGFFKDGILHGFCRYFDSKGRLTFVGMHRNGKPFGTCWKVGWWDFGANYHFSDSLSDKSEFWWDLWKRWRFSAGDLLWGPERDDRQ